MNKLEKQTEIASQVETAARKEFVKLLGESGNEFSSEESADIMLSASTVLLTRALAIKCLRSNANPRRQVSLILGEVVRQTEEEIASMTTAIIMELFGEEKTNSTFQKLNIDIRQVMEERNVDRYQGMDELKELLKGVDENEKENNKPDPDKED